MTNSRIGFRITIFWPMAALLVGEKCSRTSCTLRFFSNSPLALDQNPAILKPIQVCLIPEEVSGLWFQVMGDAMEHKGAGHRQRLRERFLKSGLEGFHDYEVIELLLTLATPRKDCKDAAKAALAEFKTLQGILEASSYELCKIKGIGPKNSLGIKLVKAVSDRYREKKLIRKNPLNNSRELMDFLNHNIGDKTREYFKIIFLDSKNRVVSTETHSKGTLTASSVYPREVVSSAIANKAAALIFAHNHPSGDPQPSQDDIAITRQLVYAGKIMGLSVHEHIIVGDNCYYSFADQGQISQMSREFDLHFK